MFFHHGSLIFILIELFCEANCTNWNKTPDLDREKLDSNLAEPVRNRTLQI